MTPPKCKICGREHWANDPHDLPKPKVGKKAAGPKKKRNRNAEKRLVMKRRYWAKKGRPMPEFDARIKANVERHGLP